MQLFPWKGMQELFWFFGLALYSLMHCRWYQIHKNSWDSSTFWPRSHTHPCCHWIIWYSKTRPVWPGLVLTQFLIYNIWNKLQIKNDATHTSLLLCFYALNSGFVTPTSNNDFDQNNGIRQSETYSKWSYFTRWWQFGYIVLIGDEICHYITN